ncbi:Hypothetical protein FKW44_023180 [Caligus rogercresseyi]|uniref:Uncharacterized protein n=1 Tax=Caligus rogercresseyi TaxID=217165 RepID=A0A7T8GNY6_CALRO|nr:Hypothetical protein FKW44_023180 [Caligus rogercresseyi]
MTDSSQGQGQHGCKVGEAHPKGSLPPPTCQGHCSWEGRLCCLSGHTRTVWRQ